MKDHEYGVYSHIDELPDEEDLNSIELEYNWDPADLDHTDLKKYPLTKNQREDITEGNETKKIDTTVDLLPQRVSHLIADMKLLGMTGRLNEEDWLELSNNNSLNDRTGSRVSKDYNLGRHLGSAFRAFQQSADLSNEWDEFVWGIVLSHIEDEDRHAERENLEYLIEYIQNKFERRFALQGYLEKAPEYSEPSEDLQEVTDSISTELTDEAIASLEIGFAGTESKERYRIKELVEYVISETPISDVCKLQKALEADISHFKHSDKKVQLIGILDVLLEEDKIEDAFGSLRTMPEVTVIDEVIERGDPVSDLKIDVRPNAPSSEGFFNYHTEGALEILLNEDDKKRLSHPMIEEIEDNNEYYVTAYGCIWRFIYEYQMNDTPSSAKFGDFVVNFGDFYAPWRNDARDKATIDITDLKKPVRLALSEISDDYD
jgi:hypothetical protein